MIKPRRLLVAVAIGLFLAATAGCSSRQRSYSGFLGEYPPFRKGPEGGADLVYIREGTDFKKYTKVMVDHVVFWLKKDADYRGIHPDEMAELSNAFHRALVEALGNAYPLVDEPGPDVFRLRIAVTDVVASKPGVDSVSTIMPVGLAITTIKKGSSGKSAGVGEASMEAEILDSLTGERLAAAIDTKAGGKLEGMTKWGPAEGAFRFWAGRLRKWLDEQNGFK